jgi:RNA polymerase sigma-70 factor (ECF subfamily)
VVLRTLYLLFNEGYARQSGPHLTDPELCDEAILLTARLVNTAIGATPQTHALLALMLLHSSRIPARIDNDGSLCLLEDQDRSRWDRARIRAGLSHLALSASGSNMTPYHCEAAIASCHAIAPGFQESDWSAILSHYDDLARMGAGPIAELNRAVALSMVHGPERGLEALSKIAAHPKLRTYYLLPATQARFLERLGRFCEARDQYLRAYELATNSAERHFLAQRLSAVLGQERNCLIIGE